MAGLRIVALTAIAVLLFGTAAHAQGWYASRWNDASCVAVNDIPAALAGERLYDHNGPYQTVDELLNRLRSLGYRVFDKTYTPFRASILDYFVEPPGTALTVQGFTMMFFHGYDTCLHYARAGLG